MTRCLALVEKDDMTYRACRNNAQEGHLCSSHSGYSFKDMLSTKRNNPLKFLHLRKQSVREVVEEWIRLGLVEITAKAIGGLIRKEFWAYFWMLCSRHTKIRPEWNMSLYKGTIEQMFRWWNVVSYGPFQVYNADILRLICVKGRCELFYQGLFCFPRGMMVGIRESDLIKLLDDVESLHPEWLLEFWMSGEHEKQLRESDHPLARMLEDVWVEKWFVQKKAGFYGRKLPFTEELCAVVYGSAKRAVDWTMDWREARDCRGRWGIQGL